MLVLLVLSLLNLIIFNFSNIYVITGSLLTLLLLIKLLVGFERSNNRYVKDSLMNTFIIVMVYHLITYAIGIFIGFYRTPYSLEFLDILINIFNSLLVIGSMELLRYACVRKLEKNKILLLFITIVFIIVDIMIVSLFFRPGITKIPLTVWSLVVIPAISKNILLSYMAMKLGYKVTIFYRILFETILYLVPIFPNFNEYITAIINFIVPIIFFAIYYKTIKKEDEKTSSLDKNYFSKALTVVLIVVTLSIIALTSGVFKYYALSIGSASMEPNIKVGDVVIVEKLEEDELNQLEVGDVLVFNRDNIVVVHRIEEINNVSGHNLYTTKGDNNATVDNWVVSENKIIGKVNFKIKYIGYPTVWLNEMIE